VNQDHLLDDKYVIFSIQIASYSFIVRFCRYFLIPLMSAERAWSYGMQLKQEANTEPRKKFHMLSRLKKAVVYALQLENVCEVRLFVWKEETILVNFS
jgi:hypothetical protein